MDNRPQGRQKHVTGHSGGVSRKGQGLGTGPVGSSGGPNHNRPSSGNTPNRSGGGGGLIKLILLLVLLFGGGAGAGSLFGGGSEEAYPVLTTPPAYTQPAPTQPAQTAPQTNPYGSLFGGSGSFGSFGSYGSGASSGSSSGWLDGANTGKLNYAVDPAAREKRTKIIGDSQDTVTIMLYMCGTDLESRSAMGTKDLQEMLNATLSDKVNLIVFTGGCTQWRNNVISSSVNQIYKVQNGGLVCLEKNAGTGSMTSSKTLSTFIQYCAKNFPANRNMLILWDHGGGSISGYGYDEKAGKGAGAMSLKKLDEALSSAKTQFDCIGFDACLMATLETGLTLAPYADYLIASEETEPGLGWYYTNWLTALSKNTSISTLELGKKIADDFVGACAQSCAGQKTTLSVVDLAELEATVPDDFKAFSASTLNLLKNDGYQTVSNARSGAREFAASTKIDQIDLVHLALNLKTAEGRALADTILSAVKYNKTSSNMTNAYGLSLYFPYQKAANVKNAVAAYDAIGLDETYTACIRTFASLEFSGQTAAGGNNTPVTTLSGQSYGSNTVGSDLLTQMLTQLLGGSSASFFDRSLDLEDTAQYLAENRFDPDALLWMADRDGYSLHLSEQQWAMVHDLELNVFVDDGEGYIDLGLDNTFDFTDNGDLVGAYDGTWLAIDNEVIAYYHTDTTEDENGCTITGRVPVLLNGSRADLILVFDTQHPYGYIAGARTDYRDGETETVAKSMTELEIGDEIEFLCDYYAYDGSYLDSYRLTDTPHIFTGNEEVSNVYIDSDAVAAYRFTDIYNAEYWTPVIPG